MKKIDYCNNKCSIPPHICDCEFMFGKQVLLTDQDRIDYQLKFEKGDVNWATPFEPWVIETWKKHSNSINGSKIADAFRNNLSNHTVLK